MEAKICSNIIAHSNYYAARPMGHIQCCTLSVFLSLTYFSFTYNWNAVQQSSHFTPYTSKF